MKCFLDWIPLNTQVRFNETPTCLYAEFQGFPDAIFAFEVLSCGPGVFFPAKHAFCPFCHKYVRAHFTKIRNLDDTQAKIYCVEFQELSNAVFAFHIIVWARVFFPPNVHFSAFLQKKNLKSDF